MQRFVKGFIRVGNCPGGWVWHAWTNAANSAEDDDGAAKSISAVRALTAPQRAGSIASKSSLVNNLSGFSAKNIFAQTECAAASDTIAATNALRGSQSGWSIAGSFRYTGSTSIFVATRFADDSKQSKVRFAYAR